MPGARKTNPETHVIGIKRSLSADQYPVVEDPGIPIDGMTFGVAMMSEDAPHGGEMHPDGDEVLYLVDGRARLIFENDEEADLDLVTGDVVIVPQGLWHRVEILEPCHFVYLTPGPNNQVRPRS